MKFTAPPIINLSGHKPRASIFIEWAKNLIPGQKTLAGGLDQFHSKPFYPANGVVVNISIVFGVITISIYAEVAGGGFVDKKYKCNCWPCFTTGIITNVYEMTEGAYISGERYRYDIDVCAKSKYVRLVGHKVRSSGYEKYEIGQLVMVTVDAKDPDTEIFDCCTDGQCLVNKLSADPTSGMYYLTISTLIPAGLKKWKLIQ